MTKHKTLSQYEEKRDFSKTPEPSHSHPPQKTKHSPIFVIQEHHASHVHWDLRIEIDGVMPSWAVPKGPSTDPKVKRLAVRTEDHPISYAHFEGVIPEGEYGAGPVMVWDIGTYENIRGPENNPIPMEMCLKDGRIEIVLNGHKLKGAFVLIQLKKSKNWLFFKVNDQFADTPKDVTETETKSALSGRTIEQIKKES